MRKTNYGSLVTIIIIDYKKNNPFLRECLAAIKRQTYRNYEVVLVTDYKNDLRYPKLRKKHYGHYVGPADKRDEGAKLAKGEILAFIDDDAFPSTKWLRALVKEFADAQVAGVGGPGMTPPHAGWQEQASGWVSVFPLGLGPYAYRFLPGRRRYVDDYPSMNLAVRKADFVKVGGFDSNYWPGEDTKLCLDLAYKLRKRIVYQPEALVYHHRRPLWWPHLRQNGNFGLHRGYFARVLPKTSLRMSYFGPSALVVALGLMMAALTLNISVPAIIKIAGGGFLLIYLLAVILNGGWVWRKSGSWQQGVISIPAVLLTHLWYGIQFFRGFLLTKSLVR